MLIRPRNCINVALIAGGERGDGVLGILKRLQGEGLLEVSAAEMPPNVM